MGGGGMDDGARRAPSSRVGLTLLTYPVFYLTLIHFYYPLDPFYYSVFIIQSASIPTLDARPSTADAPPL